MSDLPTLERRRQQLPVCERFALKASQNARYIKRFPRRTVRGRAADEEFVAMRAKRDRRYMSSIFYYRRLINNYDVRTMKTNL